MDASSPKGSQNRQARASNKVWTFSGSPGPCLSTSRPKPARAKLGVESKVQSTCTTCGKTFTRKYNLQRHVLLHKPKFEDCPICQKLFWNKNMMMHHAKRVHDESTRNCLYKNCQKTFKSATGLKDHVIKIHEKKKLKFKCTECEKSFTHQHLLERHIVSHSGICNYECKMCSKKFKYRHNLKEHQKKRSPQRK